MTESKQNIIVVGALLLLFVLVFLMSNPQEIFAKTTPVFIDVELAQSSQLQVPVQTKFPLGSADFLMTLPNTIGDWVGQDWDTKQLQRDLRTKAILLRTYSRSTFSQPVDFLLVYSGSEFAFHSPIECYPYLGYKIESTGSELVYVKDVSWLRRSKELNIKELPDWVQKQLETTPLSELGFWVSVKKIVVAQHIDGYITNRHVVLYFYIKENGVTTRYSMMRCSALAPLIGSYDSSLQSVKDFMGEVIPFLFDPVQKKQIYISILMEKGLTGYLLILFLILVPVMIIVYPVWRYRRTKRIEAARKPVQPPD